MSEAEEAKTGKVAVINVQRDQVLQQLAGIHATLDRKGVSAVFYRSAQRDPIGDLGLMGSLLFHAIIGAPIAGLINDSHLASGFSELESSLTLGTMEGLETLSEGKEKERRGGNIKSSFYPLGRNNKPMKDDKKPRAAAAGGQSRFVDNAQAELGFMFELMDTLHNLEGLDVGQVVDRREHLVIRKEANPGYNGVERRHRPRPSGMFNA